MPESKPVRFKESGKLVSDDGEVRIYDKTKRTVEGILMSDFESAVRHSLVIADSSENAVRAIVAAHKASLASEREKIMDSHFAVVKGDGRWPKEEESIRAEEREKLKVWAEAYGIKATGYSDYISRIDLLVYLSSLDKGG